MDYLTINGKSLNETFVHCKLCQNRYTWLRCYLRTDGSYVAVCRSCRLKFKNWEAKLKIMKVLK